MEQLVKLLTEIETSTIEERDFLHESDHPAVSLIEGLLCELLITKGGNVDWDAKDELESHGFRLYPLEQDRWGWIIGAVITEKGDITFG